MHGAVERIQHPLAEILGAGVLIDLNLSFNGLDGNLSDLLPWGLLSKLRFLSLAGNYLGGCVPEPIGSLTCIEEVNLCANQLTGKLPASMGPQTLPSLRVLAVAENLLLGSLEALFPSSSSSSSSEHHLETHFTRLDISSNGFDDSAWKAVLAAGRKQLLPHLASLNLANNSFEMPSAEVHKRLWVSLPGSVEIIV